MRLKYKLHFQPVGEEYLGVVIGEQSVDFSSMLQINESCYTMITPLVEAPEGKDVSRQELIDYALSVYDADEATIAKSVDDIIDTLEKEGLLA